MSVRHQCVDHLRANVPGLRNAHAHELVAAYFGYGSNIALLSDTDYPIDGIEEAQVMVPDVAKIGARLDQLNGLPPGVPNAFDIAKILTTFLSDEGWFGGAVWLYESVEDYVREVYMIENDYRILNDLSGVMAETNAYFEEAYFDEVAVEINKTGMTITASGKYYGSNDPDRVFSGDTIDMGATITLDRVAGYTCFHEEDFTVGGSVNDDWYEDA